jgi:hypothetical protein
MFNLINVPFPGAQKGGLPLKMAILEEVIQGKGEGVGLYGPIGPCTSTRSELLTP